MDEELKSILNKVKCLYLKYGIKSVTMDDVARELGISKKTLYQYVADKDELVRKVVDMTIDERVSYMEALDMSGKNPIEEVLETSRCINQILREYSHVSEYDLRKYYPDIYNAMRVVRRKHIYNMVHDNIKRGKKEGLYRKEINEDIIARLHVLRIDSIAENDVFSLEEYLSPKFFNELFEYHLRGIVNEAGWKILEENLKKYKKELNN